MPWTASDAKRFTKGADSPSSPKQWSKENTTSSKTSDDFTGNPTQGNLSGIKTASGVVKRRKYSPQKSTLLKGAVK